MNIKTDQKINILFKNHYINLSFIFVWVAAVYSNIFGNQFVMDDFDFIVDWPLIRHWKNFSQFFVGYIPPPGQEGIYSPLKTLFHAVNYHLFGLNPIGYHGVSLLIHALAIFLVYQIILFLSKNNFITMLSTFLFAIHPVNVEAITYMTASVDMIGIVFLLGSFFLYIKSQEHSEGLNPGKYVCSLILSVLAIFTHELAISIPCLFLWYNLSFQRKVRFRVILLRTGPFFLMVALYALSKFLVLKGITRGAYLYDSFYLTMLVIIKAWAKYIILCLFPLVLTHNHIISRGISSFDPDDFDRHAVLSQSPLDPPILISILILGLIFFIAFKNKKEHPIVTFCIGWFFICLLPVSHIIPSGVYFAERYLYPGVWTFCLLMSLGVHACWKAGPGVKVKALPAWISILLVLSMILLFSTRVWMRNQDWKDDVTIFEAAVRANPQSALMHNDLGIVYTQYQSPYQGITSFQNALAIRPDDPVTYFAMADAYVEVHQNSQAIAALNQAIELDPDYAEAYYNLAGIYASEGLRKKALKNLNQSMINYRRRGEIEHAQDLERAFRDWFGY